MGSGEDEVVTEDDRVKAVAEVIKQYLSTEICYDLEIGLRKTLQSYPDNGRIHVVVSNTLSLAQLGKAENLPDHIPLIIHADPKEQEILVENEVRAILLPDVYTPDTAGDPLHTTRFNQFTKAMPLADFRINLTDNNVFVFRVWDLQQLINLQEGRHIISDDDDNKS